MLCASPTNQLQHHDHAFRLHLQPRTIHACDLSREHTATHDPSPTTHTDTSFTMAAGESARVQEAQKLAKSDPRKAEAIYKEITAKAPGATSDAATREYESALISLGELYRDEKCALLSSTTEPTH